MRWIAALLATVSLCAPTHAEWPDMAEVEPDLKVPEMSEGPPAAGLRVRQVLPGYAETEVHHVLYLPSDWEPGTSYPVLVDFAGNGPYRNKFGDVSTGKVEGGKLGYGISGGKGFIWLCLPFLNAAGTGNVTQWWGDAPRYDPQPTIDYCLAAVPWVCEQFGGDPERVVLCGFSRGAIARNFIGLHDDEIAGLWRAFVAFSHYDGVRTNWPYPGVDRVAARERLKRLGGRRQFICGEGDNAQETERYLKQTGIEGHFTIRATGFRNHSDTWILRPSPVRAELRLWIEAVLAD